jgi:hypothetical protein
LDEKLKRADGGSPRPVCEARGGDMSNTKRIPIQGAAVAAGFAAILTVSGAALAQGSQSLDQRKGIYAPWSPDQMAQRRKEYGLIGPGTPKQVPTPAFPSYLKKPESVEALMPQARAAVRQTGGRTPLGLVDPGKHVLIVVGEIRDTVPDMMVQEAIKRAFEERGVKCTILTTWDTLGLSQQEYMELREGIRTYTIGDGQRELESFFTTTGFMPDAQKGRNWFAGKDPELARVTWPQQRFANERVAKLAKELFEATPNALVAWLDKNPGIDWIVWRSGHRPNSRRMLRHHGERFLGNYTYLNLYDLMSQVPAFPSDVWRLVETKTMEPLAFVERAEVTDPEGTAFGYDVDEEMAKRWAAGVYNQGHLYMYPAQATGRFPYSIVEYPSMGGAYLPPVQPETTGVIASTTSHAATHPRMEVVIEKGRVKEVRGGGLFGEGIRVLLNYPGTNDAQWPFQTKPGYWWLYEAGMGTNPKYFKHPREVAEGNNLSERNVAGVIHWALGSEVSMGPDKVGTWAAESQAFTSQREIPLPMGHSLHQHNLFPTMQVRIRELDQWITLIEHGGLTALQDLQVRALASRYGNPDDVLRRDYVTAMPGINMPGSYDQYARNPGAYWTKWAESIEAGTFEYFKP